MSTTVYTFCHKAPILLPPMSNSRKTISCFYLEEFNQLLHKQPLSSQKGETQSNTQYCFPHRVQEPKMT